MLDEQVLLTTSAVVSTRHVCLQSNILEGFDISAGSIMYKRSPPSEHPAMKPFKTTTIDNGADE